jgi:hypothetical protein
MLLAKRHKFRHADGTFPPVAGPPEGPPAAVRRAVSSPSTGQRPHGGGNDVPRFVWMRPERYSGLGLAGEG